MTTDKKRVIATFTPQKMSDDKDYIFDIENSELEVDVTSKILALPLDEIRALKDDQYNTDDLVEHEHEGPFKVEVADSILEFFGVEAMEHIAQDMLDKAKEAEPQIEKNKRKRITILVACFNGSGEADIVVMTPEVTEEEEEYGVQYEKAIAAAAEAGYLKPFVPFDLEERKNIIRGLEQSMSTERQWPWRIARQ